MNTLYNKILNEVYLIQDFDSWDNSENTFKDTIKTNLSVFVYRCPEDSESIQFFGEEWLAEDFSRHTPSILTNLKVSINPLPPRDKSPRFPKGDYNVIFSGLDGIKDCTGMFEDTNIVKCGWFDTSQCTSMTDMFCGCKYLEYVPDLNIDNVISFDGMFYKTNFYNEYWNPDEYGTPCDWWDDIDEYDE